MDMEREQHKDHRKRPENAVVCVSSASGPQKFLNESSDNVSEEHGVTRCSWGTINGI